MNNCEVEYRGYKIKLIYKKNFINGHEYTYPCTLIYDKNGQIVSEDDICAKIRYAKYKIDYLIGNEMWKDRKNRGI